MRLCQLINEVEKKFNVEIKTIGLNYRDELVLETNSDIIIIYHILFGGEVITKGKENDNDMDDLRIKAVEVMPVSEIIEVPSIETRENRGYGHYYLEIPFIGIRLVEYREDEKGYYYSKIEKKWKPFPVVE